MRPTRPDRYNAKMVYIMLQTSVDNFEKEHKTCYFVGRGAVRGRFSHKVGIRVCVTGWKCIFTILGISMGGKLPQSNAPKYKNWVLFFICLKKHPIWPKLGVFFSEQWYSEGSQNRIFLGIEKVEIAKSAWHIPLQLEIKNPPRGMQYPL